MASGSIFEIGLDTSNTKPGDVFEFDLNFRGFTSAANGATILTDSLTFSPGRLTIVGLIGDYNGNSEFDVADIEELIAAIKSESQKPVYDLDGNSTVDFADLQFWLHDIANTFAGDANLDGEFNSSDLVQIFSAGEYEDGIENNSTWSEGDWNGDCEFDSGDLVTAFQAGAYEQGPAAIAVPESQSTEVVVATVFFSILASFRRRQQSRVQNSERLTSFTFRKV
jgi:hypothetical protein